MDMTTVRQTKTNLDQQIIYNQRVSLGQYDKHHVNKTKDKIWKNYTTANQWLGRRLRLVREMQVFELLEKRKSPINGKQIKVIPK